MVTKSQQNLNQCGCTCHCGAYFITYDRVCWDWELYHFCETFCLFWAYHVEKAIFSLLHLTSQASDVKLIESPFSELSALHVG